MGVPSSHRNGIPGLRPSLSLVQEMLVPDTKPNVSDNPAGTGDPARQVHDQEVILRRTILKGCAYSHLSATIGSTRTARQAGKQQVSSATAVNTTATEAKVSGSCGATPKSKLALKRVNPKAAVTPAVKPAAPFSRPPQTPAASRPGVARRAPCGHRFHACAGPRRRKSRRKSPRRQEPGRARGLRPPLDPERQ